MTMHEDRTRNVPGPERYFTARTFIITSALVAFLAAAQTFFVLAVVWR